MMIGFAAAIASLGLTINSAAVIIGAMVIVPLQAPTPEILSRAQPTLVDLVIALVSGTAGAYAQCRRNALGALAGVAIAVALVPPLATTGLGLTLGSGTIAGGALLLFLTNLSAIAAAGSVVFLLFGFRPDPGRRVRVFSRSRVGVLIVLGLVSVLLTALTIGSIRQTRLHRALDAALAAEVGEMAAVALVDWQIDGTSEGTLRISVEVQATHSLSHGDAVDLQERVAQRVRRPVHLVLSVAHYARLDPRVTPTPVTAASDR